jgi:putative FmdB family regulatory protein
MPLYEYECEAENGRRFEIIQKFSDPVLTVCPTCGGPVRKLISSPAIQFKGSGFYITDYAKKSGVDAGKESKSGSSSGGDSSSSSSSAGSSSSTPATPAASSTPAKKD